jgi:DNA-binding transcriptional LysR family regulator
LDGGIIYPERHDTADLTVTPLYQEHQVLIAGSELLTGKADTISWADALQLPLCLLSEGMRGRRLIDDALAGQGLAATPQLEADSVGTLLAHVATGRWASIVPHTWVHTLGMPPGVSVLRLRQPSVNALLALVTHSVEPGSPVTRALVHTAREAGIAAALDEA